MKFLSSVVLVVLVVAASATFPQTPKFSRRITPFDLYDDPTCVNKCSEDCASLELCNGANIIKVNCRTQTNGQRPYCNSDSVSCDVVSDNCEPLSGNECNLQDGFYPNLIDCKRFFYCNEKKKIVYNCEGGAIFNAKSGECEFGTPCTSFDTISGLCKDKLNKLIGHPLAKNLYVFCDTNPVLLQCITTDYEFDPVSFGCSFVCRTTGRFPDVEKDNTWYYECVKNGNAISKYHRQCPKNTHFEKDLKKCMPNKY